MSFQVQPEFCVNELLRIGIEVVDSGKRENCETWATGVRKFTWPLIEESLLQFSDSVTFHPVWMLD